MFKIMIADDEKVAIDSLRFIIEKSFDDVELTPAARSGREAIELVVAHLPDILFMDEPFAALDAFTRYRLQDEVLRIWQAKKPTIIFVTHDIDEAVYLAQRVVIMSSNPGRITRTIDIKLPRPCDRGEAGLSAYRQKVFREFELIHEDGTDYAI